MVEYNEITIGRILNPTSIDLGEFVINPFLGCEFACLYCYARSNKAAGKKNKPWGEFVEVRINAASQLEKEISERKPRTVLLGSTTECFQPAEKKYGLTGKLLEILNRHKIFFVILTRSPEILDYLDLLNQGFCKKIYFTVNDFSEAYKKQLEPKSPEFSERIKAINILLRENIPIVPYFSPLLPEISVLDNIFEKFPGSVTIEFEGLNFRLKNIDEIVKNICGASPHLEEHYQKLLNEKEYYGSVWEKIKNDLANLASAHKKNHSLYIHEHGEFFKNIYSPGEMG